MPIAVTYVEHDILSRLVTLVQANALACRTLGRQAMRSARGGRVKAVIRYNGLAHVLLKVPFPVGDLDFHLV